jgi:hypothetical protein
MIVIAVYPGGKRVTPNAGGQAGRIGVSTGTT